MKLRYWCTLLILIGWFCLAACDGCSGTLSKSENPEKSEFVQTVDFGDREFRLEKSVKKEQTTQNEPLIEPIPEEPSLSIWENRPFVPLEGFDPDGGIPESHTWGEPGRGFAQKVLSFHPAAGASYGHKDFPKKLKGPPHGLGDAKGSLDVVSLGCGGSVVLEFSKPLIANGPGPDFIIFENAFFPGGKETFAEPAKISVSVDGKKWFSFPCQPDKIAWPHPKCAGIRPVYANPNNKKNIYDPKEAGGDAFDLEELGLPFARFIKIEDKSDLSPDASIWCGSYNAGFDLDAVAVIWGIQP